MMFQSGLHRANIHPISVQYVLVSSTYVVYILDGYRAKKLEASHFNKLFLIFDVFATCIIILSTTRLTNCITRKCDSKYFYHDSALLIFYYFFQEYPRKHVHLKYNLNFPLQHSTFFNEFCCVLSQYCSTQISTLRPHNCSENPN